MQKGEEKMWKKENNSKTSKEKGDKHVKEGIGSLYQEDKREKKEDF